MRRAWTQHGDLALAILLFAAPAFERDGIHVPIRFPLGPGPIAKLECMEQAEQ